MSDSNTRFDDSNPFPLFGLDDCTYYEAQMHASEVDRWLGLRAEEVEEQLRKTQRSREVWAGLPVGALLTPYIECRQILELLQLKPGETIVDFGAGFGRMGFVVSRHYPGVNFVGFEIVPERAEEGQRAYARAKCSNAKLICADIDSDQFSLPSAEAYFIYDFSSRAAIDRLLKRLQNLALKIKITVVARGRSTRDAIDHEHPWLSGVVEPRHYQNFSIYRSRMS